MQWYVMCTLQHRLVADARRRNNLHLQRRSSTVKYHWCVRDGKASFSELTACRSLSQLAAEHKVQPSGFEFVELAGDEAAIKEWIGEGADTLPLRYVSGPPALKAVGIKTANGLVALT